MTYRLAFVGWVERILRLGIAQEIDGRLLILPEWLASVGFAYLGRGRERPELRFEFDEPERAWVPGIDAACLLREGVAFRLGFMPGGWLYLPITSVIEQCPESNNVSVVIGHRGLPMAAPCFGSDPCVQAVPHFFSVGKSVEQATGDHPSG